MGCGVGRNSIAIAHAYKDINCIVECVDILDLAIEKLYLYASEHGVSTKIHGIVDSIEKYVIRQESYDFIIAVSALEHMESEESFVKKLVEIRNGIRENGIVCLVINSNVEERNKATGHITPAQFEVNYLTDVLQNVLNDIFAGWEIMKSTTKEQQYDIPRESGICDLTTNVVTLVAGKK
ncbi:MAG: class I SAM-dependent methyltransferase [Lachnospiraceae bacterium]|nr:class I SAM-dependent methyltransferase [Lachnospiraceae bacterium]